LGLRIVAAEDVPRDSHIVSCPFSLVITEQLAKSAVLSFLKNSVSDTEQWTERQWISTYIALHWISGSDERWGPLLGEEKWPELINSPQG